jgi:hypothetical protein
MYMTLLEGYCRGSFFLTESYFREGKLPTLILELVEPTHLDSSGEKFNRKPASGVFRSKLQRNLLF